MEVEAKSHEPSLGRLRRATPRDGRFAGAAPLSRGSASARGPSRPRSRAHARGRGVACEGRWRRSADPTARPGRRRGVRPRSFLPAFRLKASRLRFCGRGERERRRRRRLVHSMPSSSSVHSDTSLTGAKPTSSFSWKSAERQSGSEEPGAIDRAPEDPGVCLAGATSRTSAASVDDPEELVVRPLALEPESGDDLPDVDEGRARDRLFTLTGDRVNALCAQFGLTEGVDAVGAGGRAAPGRRRAARRTSGKGSSSRERGGSYLAAVCVFCTRVLGS